MPGPALNHDDKNLVEYTSRLKHWIMALVAAGGGGLDLSAILYVDQNGDDATGTRGDLTKPYESVSGALQDATNGDLILVGPGTFDTNANIAGALTSVAIIGMGVGVTTLNQLLGNAPCIGRSATAPMTRLLIKDISFTQEGVSTSPPILISGVNDGGASFASNGECILENLSIAVANVASCDAITATSINNITIDTVELVDAGATITLDKVASANVKGITGSGVLANVNNAAAVQPTEAISPARVSSSSFAALSNTGIAQILCDASVYVRDTLLATHIEGDVEGRLEFHGHCAGNIGLTFRRTASSNTTNFNLSHCILDGGMMIVNLDDQSRFRQYVDMRNSAIRTEADGFIVIAPNCDLDIRGSAFHQAAFVNPAGLGTLDRDHVYIAMASYPVSQLSHVGWALDFPAGATYGVVINTPASGWSSVGIDSPGETGFQVVVPDPPGVETEIPLSFVVVRAEPESLGP